MAHSQTLHGVTQWTLSGKGGIHLFLSRNDLDIRKAATEETAPPN